VATRKQIGKPEPEGDSGREVNAVWLRFFREGRRLAALAREREAAAAAADPPDPQPPKTQQASDGTEACR